MTIENQKLVELLGDLDDASRALAAAEAIAKHAEIGRVLDTARLIMVEDGGPAALESRSQVLEEAGVYLGTDWAEPQQLLPTLTPFSLASAEAATVTIECLSELRLLAVALGEYKHSAISAEQAHHFLTQSIALNLELLFSAASEAERVKQGSLAMVPRALMQHLAQRIGFEHIIDQLIEEIWRLLRQRPIQVNPVKSMITQIAICQTSEGMDFGTSGLGAARLVSSLYGPTQASTGDPGIPYYEQRLASLDGQALQAEALGFSRAMYDTGLVSPYHASFLRFILDDYENLLIDALGLSGTGRDGLLCYGDLIKALITECVSPSTAQAVYGIAMLLERGILYQQGVAQSLWRQINLTLTDWAESRLQFMCDATTTPRTRLMEGVVCMLGSPLGIGQGNNPTCQSARALSIWATSDPTYLLQMITAIARDNDLTMHFEGQAISSKQCLDASLSLLPFDLDPVSMLLVPHLDATYLEMGRLCIGREGDPHRWINPEFHGWWVGRGFCINVDVASGQLIDLEAFIRNFHAHYHPFYNGNQPLIHPQPAGIAITDSAARFIGWHAIAIMRVALDQNSEMRVYFFNPNNDSGQNWGNDVIVSTADHGERFGEASLPFEQFASRLYIFHYDTLDYGEPEKVPEESFQNVKSLIELSWGLDRIPDTGLQASAGTDGPHS
ncbi:hypothetical protein [Zhongshania arctica]|uniref:Uncharacterized protein n=1 Tax=Zhongshania arctica TaxID=3238302 RepID=A0ABV3TRP7_9GAMM